MQSVALLTLVYRRHTEQTHMDPTRSPRSAHSPPFMAGASIQKLQAQLAPAQSSQADQASCYTEGVMLRNPPAEPTEPEHTRARSHTHTHADLRGGKTFPITCTTNRDSLYPHKHSVSHTTL